MNKDLKDKALEILRSQGFQSGLFENKRLEDLIEELNVYYVELQVQRDELEAAQEKLVQSRNRYAALFHAVPVGLLELDEHLHIRETNNTFCELTGYPSSEQRSTSITRFIYPDDQDKFYLLSRKAIKGEDSGSTVIRFVKRNKEIFYGTIRFSSQVRGGESLLLLSVSDSTNTVVLEQEKSRAMTLLQERESEVSALLNAANNILKTDDFAVSAREVFNACAKLIGAKAGYVALLSEDGMENELLFLEDGGMSCLVDPKLPMPIRGLREEAHKTGRVVYDNDFMSSEWVTYMPEGHKALKNVLFSPLNIEGKTVGIMGFACKEDDFTARDARVAAAFGDYAAISLRNSLFITKLKEHSVELDGMNQTKDKLITLISHDLRSPFNTLLGLLALATEQVSRNQPEQLDYFLKILTNSTQKVYQLVVSLVEWSRLQVNGIKPRKEWFNAEESLREIERLAEASLYLKKLKLTMDIPSGARVYGDPDLVLIVVRNLLFNAIKFTPEGGSIKVVLTPGPLGSLIEVTDTGIGMTHETTEALLQGKPGGTSPGTNHEKGTGLGLFLCREVVDLHQGRFEIESAMGKGSTFRIFFPAEKKD